MAKLSLMVASLVLLSAPARAQETATVHIEGKGKLEQNGQVLCEAPCDVAVQRAGKYVIVDEATSRPFMLPRDGNVLLRVEHRQKSTLAVGGGILALSLVFAGTFFAIAATTHTNCSGLGLLCLDPAPFYAAIGGIFGGVGALVGIVLLQAPPTTVTTVHVERTQQPMPALGARFAVRF